MSVFPVLDHKSLFTCRLVCREWNENASQAIGSNKELINKTCARVLKQGRDEAATAFVRAFGTIHRGQNHTPLRITIDTDTNYTSQATVDLIAQHFPELSHVVFRRSHKTWPYDFGATLVLPSTVTTVEIDDVQFRDLPKTIANLSKIEKLIIRRISTELESEVVNYHFPKTFKDLEIDVLNNELAEKATTTAISLHSRALIPTQSIDARIDPLEQSLRLLPRFIPAKLQLALLIKDKSRAAILLSEVLQDDPENAKACALMSNLLRKIGETEKAETYYVKAHSIAIQKNDYFALLSLAFGTRSKVLIEYIYKMLDRSMPVQELVAILAQLIYICPDHIYAHLEVYTLNKACTENLQMAKELCDTHNQLAETLAYNLCIGKRNVNSSDLVRLCSVDPNDKQLDCAFFLIDFVKLIQACNQDPEPYIRFTLHVLFHRKLTESLVDMSQYLTNLKLFPDLQALCTKYINLLK